MYETMLNDVKGKMKPVVDMAEINKRAAEQIIALQTAYMNDLFTAGMAQMNALAMVRDPRQAAEMQIGYFKQLETNLKQTAEKELAVMTEARDEMSGVVEQSFAGMGELPWVGQMNTMMESMNTPAAAPAKAEAPAEASKEDGKKVTARRKTAA